MDKDEINILRNGNYYIVVFNIRQVLPTRTEYCEQPNWVPAWCHCWHGRVHKESLFFPHVFKISYIIYVKPARILSPGHQCPCHTALTQCPSQTSTHTNQAVLGQFNLEAKQWANYHHTCNPFNYIN